MQIFTATCAQESHVDVAADKLEELGRGAFVGAVQADTHFGNESEAHAQIFGVLLVASFLWAS